MKQILIVILSRQLCNMYNWFQSLFSENVFLEMKEDGGSLNKREIEIFVVVVYKTDDLSTVYLFDKCVADLTFQKRVSIFLIFVVLYVYTMLL